MTLRPFQFPIRLRFSQRRFKWLVPLSVFALLVSQNIAQARCENIKDISAVVCAFDPVKDELRLFWRDAQGEPFGGFDRLAKQVAGSGKTLAFAMNAGMYQPDLAPVGLYVEDGHQHHAANLRAGTGNFGLRPNGVFWIDGTRAGVTETSKFLSMGTRPRFATQSGPMLVMGGRIHPKIRPDGTSEKIRNGVGVCEDGRVRFVISDVPITFHNFATLFRDRLKCPDALYLDGSISALYAPNLSRNDGWRAMGPIVGVVEKK